MKKNSCLLIFAIFLAASCKSKKTETVKKDYISVVSLIEKQVAHVDTSLYSIKQITIIDSLHSDTSYIRREDFRQAAKEFLAIPDLSVKEIAEKYKEEPTRYDQLLDRVIITYTAIDPDKEEYKSQELLVAPGTLEGDKVTNVLVTRSFHNRDSSLLKTMLWRMDKSFQITTTTQKPAQSGKTTTVKVDWNEDDLP